jgi:hypothetical protein
MKSAFADQVCLSEERHLYLFLLSVFGHSCVFCLRPASLPQPDVSGKCNWQALIFLKKSPNSRMEGDASSKGAARTRPDWIWPTMKSQGPR